MNSVHASDRLSPGGVIDNGYAINSANGLWQLGMFKDGNLILARMDGDHWAKYINGRPINNPILWESKTYKGDKSWLQMQYDCNLVLYSDRHWGDYLRMGVNQKDGRWIGDYPLWASNTGGKGSVNCWVVM